MDVSWQIFLDMAVLVEAQGELLDNIETQASCFTSPCSLFFLFWETFSNALVPYFSNECSSNFGNF
jgi:hypothetical protein